MRPHDDTKTRANHNNSFEPLPSSLLAAKTVTGSRSRSASVGIAAMGCNRRHSNVIEASLVSVLLLGVVGALTAPGVTENRSRVEASESLQQRIRATGFLFNRLLVDTNGVYYLDCSGQAFTNLTLLRTAVWPDICAEHIGLKSPAPPGITATTIDRRAFPPRLWLYLINVPISDLSPLKGLPIVGFDARGTKVHDLSALKGMRLFELNLNSTPVRDLRPLAGMPLQLLDI